MDPHHPTEAQSENPSNYHHLPHGPSLMLTPTHRSHIGLSSTVTPSLPHSNSKVPLWATTIPGDTLLILVRQDNFLSGSTSWTIKAHAFNRTVQEGTRQKEMTSRDSNKNSKLSFSKTKSLFHLFYHLP